MKHPDTRLLARYALGDITDDAELASLEDHLLECDQCRRRAVAVDLIGTSEADKHLCLHIARNTTGPAVALCGDDGSRNIISPDLLPGFNRSVICGKCLALADRPH